MNHSIAERFDVNEALDRFACAAPPAPVDFDIDPIHSGLGLAPAEPQPPARLGAVAAGIRRAQADGRMLSDVVLSHGAELAEPIEHYFEALADWRRALCRYVERRVVAKEVAWRWAWAAMMLVGRPAVFRTGPEEVALVWGDGRVQTIRRCPGGAGPASEGPVSEVPVSEPIVSPPAPEAPGPAGGDLPAERVAEEPRPAGAGEQSEEPAASALTG